MSKKKALGRGLNALLSDSNTEDRLEIDAPVSKTPVTTNPTASSGCTLEIPLTQIEVNPFQPRTYFDQQALQELADSIKVHGIIQPITVRRLARDQYQLISGERRFQASKLAGLKSVPAYIRSADDQQMLEMALIENIQRENLNAIEVALSYQRLITECNLNQEALGDRVGKNRATVTNYLRLLKLPPDIQIAVRDNRISNGPCGVQLLMLKVLTISFTSLKRPYQKIFQFVRLKSLCVSLPPLKKKKKAPLLRQLPQIVK